MSHFSARMRFPIKTLRAVSLATSLAVLTFAGGCASTRITNSHAETLPQGTLGVPSVGDAQLDPDFWIRRQSLANSPLLDATTVIARNANLFARDPSMHDLAAMPSTLTSAQVRGWIEGISSRPTRTL